MLTIEQKTFINHFIQAVYVINLPQRSDRLKNLSKEFNKVIYRYFPKIIEGIRFSNLHYLSGRAGCSAAHTRALQTAYDYNLENFLLLEDDCFFVDDRLESIYFACKDLEKINWDLCYFGARIKSKMVDFSNGLYRINNWGCNHCVLYNRKTIKYLLDLLPKWDAGYNVWMGWIMKNECFDIWQSRILGQNADFYCFHSKDLVALQTPNMSDINQKHADGLVLFEEGFEENKP